MAIHWLARVPWAEIIANAPRIVAGAKKLSEQLRKPRAGVTPTPEPDRGGPKTVEQEIAALKAKLRELEAAQESSAQVVQSLAANSEKMAQALAPLKAQAVMNFRLAVVCLVGVVALLIYVIFM